MKYCINPLCPQRENFDDVENCLSCGTSLLINKRIRLIKPLRPLTDEPHSYFEVFEVDDMGTQWNPVRKLRVMKVLKWNSSKLRELIEREALSLQLIRHPCIPRTTIDDFFNFAPENSPLELRCLVMDKFDGQNLEEWLESNIRGSQSLALEWLQQLVDILDTVHRSNFFHRDIKPSNIILQPNGQLALVDFGVAREVTNTYLAKVSGSATTNTGRGGRYEITSVVTPGYTPIEQIEGQAVPQSDFFALGRTFVHLVTGTQPIDLSKDKRTGRLIWRDKATQIDKPFADFLDELMAPLPGNRPATTKVISQRLEKLPQQNKIYRLAKSKKVVFSVLFILMVLGFIGCFKFIKPVMANNLVVQGKKSELANDSETAQNYFNQAIEYNPKLQLSISQFYLEQAGRYFNDFKLAKKYYELALKYNDKDTNAYNSLAVVCWQLEEVDCALESYQHILKLKPNDWEGYYRLGSFYDQEGKEDLAQEKYKIAIKINKKAVPALNDLSRLRNLKQDYIQATALALEGLRLTEDPKLQAALYKNLGWAKFMQNQYKEAEKYLQKASDLDSKRIDAVCLLAQVQEALGKIEDARLSWEICMLVSTTQQDVFKWRQELLDRLTSKSKIFH